MSVDLKAASIRAASTATRCHGAGRIPAVRSAPPGPARRLRSVAPSMPVPHRTPGFCRNRIRMLHTRDPELWLPSQPGVISPW
ncbi:hypothetical protein SHO565_54160 [Streptomyces sp. HO565]